MNAEQIISFFLGGNKYLVENKAAVDALNVFPVPDGDTGTNMSLTMQAAVKEINLQSDRVADVARSVANGSLMGARGNSGVILSQLFRGLAQGLTGLEASAAELAKALQTAVDLAYKAVMRPVEGTILTVAKACAAGAKEAAQKGADSLQVMEAALEYGEKALAKTPEQLPALKEAGVVDAGGKGLLVIFAGGIKAIKGEEMEDLLLADRDAQSGTVSREEQGQQEELELEYRYCTELIIKGMSLDGSSFRSKLESLGDSLLVVGTDRMLKVHIHTNDPGRVLQYAADLGTMHDIKIDNMSTQHRNTINTEQSEPAAGESKDVGVIAVAPGDGLTEVLRSLGVDRIISGGQTMNPSTEDLVCAINDTPAREIVVLPNNKNIILAAQQAQKLITEKKVEVIPTKTFPQGVAALLSFDAGATAADNRRLMSSAIDLVASGEVTYAVRDAAVNGLEIHEGDIIGLKDGNIEVVGGTARDVVLKLLEQLMDAESELLTVYYGAEVTAQEAEDLQADLLRQFPQLEIEIYNGGQPLYYYIISVE